MLLLTLAATAQKKAVTGTVTDTNKEPLIGATVREAGTTNGDQVKKLWGKILCINICQSEKKKFHISHSSE